MPAPLTTIDVVVDLLQSEILRGSLRGGTRLRESKIAQEFGFARHTVRAALVRLEFNGLAEFVANKGWSVRVVDAKAAREINDARMAIEMFAYTSLTRNPRPIPEQVREVLASIENAQDGDPVADLIAADFALHSALVAAAGNARLHSIYGTLVLESQLTRLQAPGLSDAISIGVSIWKSTHAAIVSAIEGGDRRVLTELMADHTWDWVTVPTPDELRLVVK